MAYAAPVVPTVLLLASVNVVQGVYARDYGLSLTSISGVLLIAGLFDAVTDPAIGYFSDRRRAKTGSRRGFIVAGAIFFPVSAYFFFVPVGEPTAAYFLVCYLAFFFSLTLFQIPHLAVGGETAVSPEQRTRIFSYRTFAGYLGFMAFAAIPILPLTATSQVTPQTLKLTVAAAALLLVPSMMLFLRRVPAQADRAVTPAQEHPLRAIRSLVANAPFVLFIGGFTLYGLSTGLGWALIFVVIDSYMGQGGAYAYLYLFHLLVACASVMFGARVIRRLGKKRTLFVAVGLSAAAYMIWPVGLAAPPVGLGAAALFMLLMGPASALGNVAAVALLADIADYESWRSRRDRMAASYGVMNLGLKTTSTIGAATAFAIAGGFGFDPSSGDQPASVFWGLCIAMSAAPAVLCLAAIVIISRIRLTEQHHAIVRKRLDDLSRRRGGGGRQVDSNQTQKERPQSGLCERSIQS